jgi:hypothetical protein
MRRDNGDVTCFVGASTLKSNLAEGVRNFIDKRISDSWDSFEDFTTAMNSIWQLKRIENGTSVHFHCTCCQFLKRNVCKHSVGIELRLKISQAPLLAKNIPLGEK